jgi:hypothetical protein
VLDEVMTGAGAVDPEACFQTRMRWSAVFGWVGRARLENRRQVVNNCRATRWSATQLQNWPICAHPRPSRATHRSRKYSAI